MKSPFPGMNPFLEGDLWPEVHHELISKIKKLLIPLLGTKYVARIEKYVVSDTHAANDLGIMYPDVGVFKHKVSEPETAYAKRKELTPPTITIPHPKTIEVRIPFLKIIDLKNNRLVTALEVLSPVNKRNPGFKPYLQKKQKLIENGINFLELDFLRRGRRTIEDNRLEKIDYLVALTRALSEKTEVWIVDLSTPLPTIPIPLLPTDKDILIDLQQVLNEVYEESRFDRSINYKETPPPPFIEVERYQHYLNA